MGDSFEGRCRLFSEQVPPSNHHHHQISIEALVDSLVAFQKDIQEVGVNENVTAFVQRFTPLIEAIKPMRIQESDFETLKVLGRGGFGEVRLVKCKLDGQVYAMKLLRKSKLLTEREAAFFKEERDVMALSKNTWLTTLHFAFQDDNFLFLAMEYVAGGSLLNLLFKWDVFDEDQTRFYVAEIVHAIEEIHNMGYCHRDIKPDNLLIDAKGHIKLTDFGSAIKGDATGKIHSDVPVGTPEYISPEVLQAQEKGASIGFECDWWALGIMMYEFLVGEVPFYDESVLAMYGKIMGYKKHLKFPDDVELSAEAKDLMKKLICDSSERLGAKGGAKEILAHPFFKGLDVHNIRNVTPPFVPELKDPADTSNFDEVEPPEDGADPLAETAPTKKGRGFQGNNLPFIGFSFNRRFKYGTGASADTGSSSAPAPAASSATSAASSAIAAANETSKKLQTELEQLQSKLAKVEKELDASKTSYEQQAKRVQSLEATNKNLLDDLNQMTDQITKSQDNLATASDIEMAKAKAETEAKQATDHAERLKAEKASLVEEIESLKTRIKDQQQQLATANQKYQDLNSSVGSLKAEQEALSAELSTSSTKLRKAQSQIKEKEQEAEKLAEQLLTAKNELAAAKKAAEANEQKLKEAETHLEEERAKHLKMGASSSQLDSKIAALEQKVAELTTALSASEAQVAAQEKAKSEITMQKAMIEVEVNDLKGKLAGLAAELKAKDEKIEKLKSDLGQAGGDKQKLNDLSNKHQFLESQLEELKAKLSEKEAATKAVEAQISEVKREKMHLQVEYDEVKQKAEKYQNNEKNLTAEIDRLKGELQSLQESKVKETKTQESEKLTLLEQQYKKELANAEIKLKALQADLTRNEAAAEALVAAKKELVVAKADLELSLKEATEKLKATKAELDSTLANLATEKDSNRKLMESTSKMKEERAALEKELAELKQGAASMKNVNHELLEARKENKLTMLQLEETNRKLEAEALLVKDLHKKLEEATERAKTSQNEKKEALNQLAEAKAVSKSLEDQLKATNASLEKSKKQAEESAALSAQLKQDLTALQNEIKRTTGDHATEIESLTAASEAKLTREIQEKKRLEDLVTKVRGEMQALQSEYETTKENLEKNQKHSSSLEAALEKLRADQEALQVTVAQLEGTVKTQGNQLISSDIKNKSLTAQIAMEVSNREALQQTVASKDSIIEGLEEKIREKDQALEQKDAKIDKLHDDVSQALMNLDQKEKDIKQLKHDMKQIELLAEMSGATASVTTSGTTNPKLELRNLRQEKSKLQQQLDNEKRRSVQLQSELAEVNQELIDLRQTLEAMKEREKEAEKKNSIQGGNSNESGAFLSSAFSLIRKTSNVKKSTRSESIATAIPFSDKLEGALEYRQVKGGTAKWKKVYGNVIDMRLYIFEKSDHKDNKAKAIANFDIRSYIFIARQASIQHIRNVDPDELVVIFGIWEKDAHSSSDHGDSSFLLGDSKADAASIHSATVEDSRLYDLSLAELEERIKKVQADIAKEEGIVKGLTAMSKVVKGQQKEAAIVQLDGSQKMIAKLNGMLESMQHVADEKRKNPEAAKGTPSAASTSGAPSAKAEETKKALEADLERALHTQDALQKMLASPGSEKTKQVARQQLTETQAKIEKLKAELANPITITITQEAETIADHNGHSFKMKHYNAPTNCYHCHEPLKLYNQNNEGLTCSTCHFVCHKQCQPSLNLTCDQSMEAKSIPGAFFKTQDEYDRRRWVIQLQRLRNSAVSKS